MIEGSVGAPVGKVRAEDPDANQNREIYYSVRLMEENWIAKYEILVQDFIKNINLQLALALNLLSIFRCPKTLPSPSTRSVANWERGQTLTLSASRCITSWSQQGIIIRLVFACIYGPQTRAILNYVHITLWIHLSRDTFSRDGGREPRIATATVTVLVQDTSDEVISFFETMMGVLKIIMYLFYTKY